MRKVHTLTYNETTYTIDLNQVQSFIFINNVKTDYYLQYYPEVLEGNDEGKIPSVEHYRLNKNNDLADRSHLHSIRGNDLTFSGLSTIINIINSDNSFNDMMNASL
jgi:hypothetical protein